MSVRVLIVDDSELVRDGLRMALEPAPGIEIAGEAGDGAAGVAEADRLRPDVVLMDVRMPELDGIEATRRIVALVDPAATLPLIGRVTRSHPPSAPPAGLEELTAPEREILDLIAGGLPNAEIAARLAVGEQAVAARVADVLAKLQARDRVHAVLVAYQSRLARPSR